MKDQPDQKQMTIQEALEILEKQKSLPERLKELEKRDGPSLDDLIE